MSIERVRVIDSHTGGEPTRIVIEGGPDLGSGSAAERLRRFREEHDDFRNAVVNEPRGSDVIVGALLFEPNDPTCTAGVIFFNNVGYLGMCGHGTIGLAVTLAYLGRIGPGVHRIETPAGIVTAELLPDGHVTVENVPSYRLAADIEVDVPGYGAVTGDIAWGGNWFFLVEKHPFALTTAELPELMRFTTAVRHALAKHPIVIPNGGEVDHIELFVPSDDPAINSRNYVLCPGLAYDRSPCGTGTSAKLACLHAAGKLAEGETWRQQSVIGSHFDGAYRVEGECVVPRITGTAFVNADTIQIFNSDDPFCMGIKL